MDNELTDFMVTSDTITRVEEYCPPDTEYEVIIGIPAAFTPVCESELRELDGGNGLFLGYPARIVMVDNPNSVRAWLKEAGLDNIIVSVSEYAAICHDLTTGDLERPVSRTMVVNHYHKEHNDVTRRFSTWPGMFQDGMPYKSELLRYTCHMDIPRNFGEIGRVIRAHDEGRLA